MDNTIYDVWLYEIKAEQAENLDKKYVLSFDKQKLKECIHNGLVSDKIPCLNEYLNNEMYGRLYRKNTMDDIIPCIMIEDEKSLKKLSELNSKSYTNDEIMQKIKSGIRACEMRVMDPIEFYQIVKSLVK